MGNNAIAYFQDIRQGMRTNLGQDATSDLDGYSNRRTKSVFFVAMVSLVVIYAAAVAVGQTGAFNLSPEQAKDTGPEVIEAEPELQSGASVASNRLAATTRPQDSAVSMFPRARPAQTQVDLP